ncbi:hypothetical protein ACR82Z_03370 [Mycoplasma sp. 6243]|uniref:hypothetical protein n=1 Tax=Mycoplasma sp. 6243 TaxID=3440865 RepID=UPI003EB6C46B
MKHKVKLWKIGDTSWRKNNQIALYNFVIDYIYKQNIISDLLGEYQNFWNVCVKEGFKQKNTSYLEKDINLLFKTLRNFSLIKKNEKKENNITLLKNRDGSFFYNILGGTKGNSEIFRLLDLFGEYFGISSDTFIWICLFLKFNTKDINDKFQSKYPFYELFSSLCKRKFMSKDNLINLHFAIEENRSEKWKEFNFRKKIKNWKFYNTLSEKIKDKNYDKEWEINFERIFSLKNSEKIIKILSLIVKKRLHLEWKVQNRKQIIDFFKNIPFNEFNEQVSYYSDILTAKEEYLNLTLYWLKNLEIFTIDYNDNEKYLTFRNDEIRNFFKFLILEDRKMLLNNLTTSSLEDFVKQILKIFEIYINQTNIQKYQKALIPPFDLWEVVSFIKNGININTYLHKIKLDQSKEKWEHLNGISRAILTEYFINLYVWYITKEKYWYDNFPEFQDFANTLLDYNLYPKMTAPGGQPDASFVSKELNIIVETTILNNKSQLIKNEIEPNKRHAFEIWKNNKVKTIVLLFSETIFKSFLQYLYFAFDESKDLIKENNTNLWVNTSKMITIKPILIQEYFQNVNNFTDHIIELLENIEKTNNLIKEQIVNNDNFNDDNVTELMFIEAITK